MREANIAVVESYLNGLMNKDLSGVPFGTRCHLRRAIITSAERRASRQGVSGRLVPGHKRHAYPATYRRRRVYGDPVRDGYAVWLHSCLRLFPRRRESASADTSLL